MNNLPQNPASIWDSQLDAINMPDNIHPNKLKSQFKKVADAYIKKFCEKQGFDYRDVHNIAGTYEIISVSDFHFSLDNIRLDIDDNRKKGEILKWHDECIDGLEINYYSYKHLIK